MNKDARETFNQMFPETQTMVNPEHKRWATRGRILAICVGAIGGLALMYQVRSYTPITVFDGAVSIDGKDAQVKYVEGDRFGFPPVQALNSNTMTITIDDTTYTFSDWSHEEDVGHVITQSLENVVVTSTNNDKKKDEYSMSSLYDLDGTIMSTEYSGRTVIDKEHTKTIFEKANALYNTIRTKIREQILQKYQAQEKSIPITSE